MATVAINKQPRGLFVSTSSPSTPSDLGLSLISTTIAKQTETPRQLKDSESRASGRDNNNNDEEEGQQDQHESTRLGLKRSDSWSSRVAGFSPRPKRHTNPARRPVQSVSSIRGLRLDDEEEEQELVHYQNDEPLVGSDHGEIGKKSESFRLSNQSQLERIQEADSADETENDSQDEEDENEADEYDDDVEDEDVDAEADAARLYKSFSGDLVVCYDGLKRGGGGGGAQRRSHEDYDEEDNDVVQF